MTTTRSRLKELAALAAPIAGIQLAQVALTTTDTIMMGVLGAIALAAGGLAITLFNQVRTMCVGLITGLGNQIAHAQGRGAPADQVRGIARAGLIVATLAGLLGAVLLVALSYALAWLGQDPQVLAGARPMMAALAPGLVPLLWLQALRQFAVGVRKPKSLLPVMLASIAVNAALNFAFVYGWLGAPRLGLTGVGLATTFVQLFSVAAFWLIVRRDRDLAPLLTGTGRPTAREIKDVLALGLPTALTYGSEAGLFSVAALLIGHFGAAALAAHNAVNQIVYIVFQISVGLSHGSSVLVSHAMGRREPAEAREAAKTALSVGGAVMALIGAVYLIAPRLVLWPFHISGDAAAIAGTLLIVAVVQQFFDNAQNIAVGLLRGLGDAKSGLKITLVGYWAVGLPVALVGGLALGWGAPGVWLGLSAGLAFCAAMMVRAFLRGTATGAGAPPG
ncbi:MATE family efflux transporter [Segniliparus rotundus]|uniref:MATE family efflux transporter n=1 Tax=Segniliparus rotundus TaxID=286802 RepID=UPI001FE179BD|nr:MATE family efflux transporter [Segniliparus rotundus]